MRRIGLNPTLIGTAAVIIWGLSLTLSRLISSEIGIAATLGAVFAGGGCLSLLNQRRTRKSFPPKQVFKNPLTYARWILFALNPTTVWTASTIVSKPHLPMVILINYLWPTEIILFSILIAGVKITRPSFFFFGTMVVIAALSIEILRPDTLSTGLFDNPTDRLAYGLSFTSAFCWAMFTALTRRFGDATGGAAMIPFFQLTLGIALPLSFMPGVGHWDHLTTGIVALLVTWSVLQFTAMLSWDFGTRNGNIVILSLCADFIPWLSLAAAHMLLGVEIGNKTILSALLLVAGAMITRYGTLTRRGEKAQLEELAHEHSPVD